MTQTEALKLALEALDGAETLLSQMGLTHLLVYGNVDKAITAIKEALSSTNGEAQPAVALEQEPVAWRHDMGEENGGWEYFEQASCPDCQPLYTTPPQRTWVGLTEEDMDWLHANTPCIEGNYGYRFIRAIEAKLKEKNT